MPQEKEIALFVTCLIDNLRPSIGFDVVALLEQSGYKVIVPEAQTCCGQVNYNGGDNKNAQKTARKVIDTFLPFETVVVPSGSCGSMIKHHYIELLSDDPDYQQKAKLLANKVFELSCFLTEVAQFEARHKIDKKVSYHDACAGLREMGIKAQPRQLLSEAGAEIIELAEAETCCGFGGAFCVKYPDISDAMVSNKIKDAQASGASALVTGDLGCLMNMEGKLNREGVELPVYHFAELLNGKGLEGETH